MMGKQCPAPRAGLPAGSTGYSPSKHHSKPCLFLSTTPEREISKQTNQAKQNHKQTNPRTTPPQKKPKNNSKKTPEPPPTPNQPHSLLLLVMGSANISPWLQKQRGQRKSKCRATPVIYSKKLIRTVTRDHEIMLRFWAHIQLRECQIQPSVKTGEDIGTIALQKSLLVERWLKSCKQILFCLKTQLGSNTHILLMILSKIQMKIHVRVWCV